MFVDGFLHGVTGTGTPLMPTVYTYGAFWAVGDVEVNGEIVDEDHVIHFMTTETVRTRDYELAFDRDLPLPEDQTVAGQQHHTHAFVMPVYVTPEGPVYEPLDTAFELPNGELQPFIHVMFEQDEVVEGPEFELPDEVRRP